MRKNVNVGQAYSNVVYLFGGLSILLMLQGDRHAASPSKSYYADTLFGVNLVLLSGASFVWHGSNYPPSQYVDLVMMNANIFYFLVRSAAGTALIWLPSLNQDVLCLFLYSVASLAFIYEQCENYRTGFFDAGFPISGRARISNGTINMGVLLSLALLPAVYYLPPLAYMLYASCGSNFLIYFGTFCLVESF